jgi:hypothetical protein
MHTVLRIAKKEGNNCCSALDCRWTLNSSEVLKGLSAPKIELVSRANPLLEIILSSIMMLYLRDARVYISVIQI